VLERVIALTERRPVVPLLAKHEEMLPAALGGPSEVRSWLKFGGTGHARPGREPAPKSPGKAARNVPASQTTWGFFEKPPMR
jgi:poly(3-hydroxybutyrate) depolymerase